MGGYHLTSSIWGQTRFDRAELEGRIFQGGKQHKQSQGGGRRWKDRAVQQKVQKSNDGRYYEKKKVCLHVSICKTGSLCCTAESDRAL